MDTELKAAFQKLDDLMGAGIITEVDYKLRKDQLIEKYMSGAEKAAPVGPQRAPGAMPPGPAAVAMGGEVQKLLCSTHNKFRSGTCLEQVGTKDDGTPVWSCTMMSQCKINPPTGAPAAAAAAAPMVGGKGAWTAQAPGGFKRPWPGAEAPGGYGAGGAPLKRPRGAVTQWGAPQVGGFQQGWNQQNAWNQPNAWNAGGAGAWDMPEKATCMRHNKQRSTGSMLQGPQGWICRDDSMCKTGDQAVDQGTVFTCAAHGRTRAANYLEQAPDGTWNCKPGKECKISTKPAEEVAF
uniref:SHOCT domain-containing protein n=1 Tax=Eutreptiella gymnastica TaxID=73025 RepID=A0A7S1IC50_9EUGL